MDNVFRLVISDDKKCRHTINMSVFMIKLFLKLRGTPVVIITDEFQGWEEIEMVYFFLS